MRGADGEPRLASVHQLEIDQFVQRALQRRGRIITGAICAERIAVAGMGKRIGPEETGNAVSYRRPIGELFVEARKNVAKIPDRALLHLLPKLAQAGEAVLRRVTRDEAGVRRAV